MTTKDKLIERFKTLPKDFTFNELSQLLKGFGFEISNKGKTSGSRIRFINVESKSILDMHKPHPGNVIKEGALKDIYEKLILNGFINKKGQHKKEK
ncbi:MAG: type II toxin-antitoxin system HicA family toxin [Mangrovibacterium sp.]